MATERAFESCGRSRPHELLLNLGYQISVATDCNRYLRYYELRMIHKFQSVRHKINITVLSFLAEMCFNYQQVL